MTLASFLFSAVECFLLHGMAREVSASEGKGSAGMVKLLELALALAYIVYDTATTEPPGGGTTALIVVACLAEVLLLCFEGYTVWKFEAMVWPELFRRIAGRIQKTDMRASSGVSGRTIVSV